MNCEFINVVFKLTLQTACWKFWVRVISCLYYLDESSEYNKIRKPSEVSCFSHGRLNSSRLPEQRNNLLFSLF